MFQKLLATLVALTFISSAMADVVTHSADFTVWDYECVNKLPMAGHTRSNETDDDYDSDYENVNDQSDLASVEE